MVHNFGNTKRKTALPIHIRPAVASDVGLILQFIKALAAYEKLSDAVVVTEESLLKSLFGARPQAEVLIAELVDDRSALRPIEPVGSRAVGFALFFHNYSTFLGRHGLYLEDLFVLPEARSKGVGKSLLLTLARIAKDRQCGRFEWSVLDWNIDAIKFYEKLGAKAMHDWTGYRLEGEALTALANSVSS
jgi:GNAT superfamily N-acetyltransferase